MAETRKNEKEILEKVENKQNRFADFIYKIMFIGNASVQKSNLAYRYVRTIFIKDSQGAMPVDFYSEKIKLTNGKNVKFQIWDFNCEEKNKNLLPIYSKNANAVFIIFDIGDKNSIANIDDWYRIVIGNGRDIPIYLIGLFTDSASNREITQNEGKELVNKCNMESYLEINPKSGENVKESYEMIYQLMLKESENHPKFSDGKLQNKMRHG